jgi:hypothetical protein
MAKDYLRSPKGKIILLIAYTICFILTCLIQHM